MASAASKKVIDDAAKLSGAEKAAVILMALGDEQAPLWSQMDEEELRVVSQAMASLGNVTSTAVEKLIIEFVGQMSSTGSIIGSVERTHKLLQSFLDEDRVEAIMEELRRPAGRTLRAHGTH